MLKHRELHTLDEEEIRDEIKRRKKLGETREEREQLVRQIADEEGRPHEYCDIDTPDTEEGPLPVEEELLTDDQTYTRKIERGSQWPNCPPVLSKLPSKQRSTCRTSTSAREDAWRVKEKLKEDRA